ncbi:RNA-directed DNA polymerase from mobile element jockey-like protein [Elysia marginata]|uniref:RNA-directed DNA polymerase from mobile element jockey-like protein n=1 Tax=Elysia marginata TaxID=1093978 RepID=A0AAV4HAG6_9GAST|nr:RNA-directed DNA polymerase from mobile element jockey-like protein [Elysia marginata]
MRGPKTMETTEDLLESLQQSRKERWTEIVENMNCTHSSRHAWQTIKKLDPDFRPTKNAPLISLDEIAKEIKKEGKTHQIRVLKNRPGQSIKQSWLGY